MIRRVSLVCGLLVVLPLAGCLRPSTLPPDPRQPNAATRRIVAERLSAVIVAAPGTLRNMASRRMPKHGGNDEVDGGSAAPVSADGYFLTADHVLAHLGNGRNAYVIYGIGGQSRSAPARVVWRSKADDLALLHAPFPTPRFYYWTAPGLGLPEGTPVMHGGIATGKESEPGTLATAIPPEGRFTGARKFRIDIPLKPGDSGGPVVDAYGRLIGVNSAVVFLVPLDTAFFVDSEASRPSIRKLGRIIEKDRRKNGAGVGVWPAVP